MIFSSVGARSSLIGSYLQRDRMFFCGCDVSGIKVIDSVEKQLNVIFRASAFLGLLLLQALFNDSAIGLEGKNVG